MMGNFYAKFKNNINQALKYYSQAVLSNPKDSIALNNIGANLMQIGRVSEAKEFFTQALTINPSYPNTHFALGMIAETENDLTTSFNFTIESLKNNRQRDPLYQNSVKQLFDVAKKMISKNSEQISNILDNYLKKLENNTGKHIEKIEDLTIPTAAKIEFAENYKRDYHIIKIKPGYPAVNHLAMHELTHLEYAEEARKTGINMLFVSTPEHKRRFISSLGETVKKFHKMRFSEESIAAYCSSLFDGINRQIFNTPVDLFIENDLFNKYEELRPLQLVSLQAIIQEGLKAVTDKKIIELSLKDILSKSRIFNIVSAIQFRELFGIDLIKSFDATAQELKTANLFYGQYQQMRESRKVGDEYQLIQKWGEILNLDKFFKLVDENEFRKAEKESNTDFLIEPASDFGYKNPKKQKEMETFIKNQEASGTNMAVVMYMVDALQYFEKMSKERIKTIAFEIAMQGAKGYNPDNKDYKLASIPDKIFTGYHILAYYFVSWAIAIPEKLYDLYLPFEAEYKLALLMSKGDETVN